VAVGFAAAAAGFLLPLARGGRGAAAAAGFFVAFALLSLLSLCSAVPFSVGAFGFLSAVDGRLGAGFEAVAPVLLRSAVLPAALAADFLEGAFFASFALLLAEDESSDAGAAAGAASGSLAVVESEDGAAAAAGAGAVSYAQTQIAKWSVSKHTSLPAALLRIHSWRRRPC
jgi:hypothetical protein